MIQQERKPWRFGLHASLIQLVALFVASTSLDGGATLSACALAASLFWACAISLLFWRPGRASWVYRFFCRWGLLAFVLLGTPLFWPVVEMWRWLDLVLLPSVALQLVASLMYVFVRVFGLDSPFDDVSLPPAT